jgi:hypothetical protein
VKEYTPLDMLQFPPTTTLPQLPKAVKDVGDKFPVKQNVVVSDIASYVIDETLHPLTPAPVS